jgi:hypothetical protein
MITDLTSKAAVAMVSFKQLLPFSTSGLVDTSVIFLPAFNFIIIRSTLNAFTLLQQKNSSLLADLHTKF